MASHPRSSMDNASSRSRDHRTSTTAQPSRSRRKETQDDMYSLALPEHLRSEADDEEEEEEEEDDDDDDNNADDKGGDGTGVGNEDRTSMFVQQSMYGMLAATQSRAAFPSQFQQQDSGSESEAESTRADSTRRVARVATTATYRRALPSGKSSDGLPSQPYERVAPPSGSAPYHRGKLPNPKLAALSLRPAQRHSNENDTSLMTQSQILPPHDSRPTRPRRRSSPTSVRHDLPVLDQKLRAMAKAGMQLSSRTTGSRLAEEAVNASPEAATKAAKPLAHVIASIFNFPEPEDVIAEYPCWYLQNVLLEGYMYVTQHHVCFYAYLQKKTNVVVKSGYLDKLPKHGLRYHRYWFVLKGDTFSYHEKASEPYFPLNQVDLRFAISADVSPPTEQDKESTEFTITTPGRIYYYRAENSDSAKEWVKQLQRVIFRGHNDGDSVKISLPIDNILDLERTTVIESAETIKLRIIDNEETFAVDEYFFSFFNLGNQALDVLSGLIEHVSAHGKRSSARSSPERTSSTPGTPVRDGKHTNTVHQSSRDRQSSQSSPSILASAESLTSASELAPSSISTGEEIDADMSASQMLIDEGVFNGPTLRLQAQQSYFASVNPAIDRLRQGLRPLRAESSASQPARQSLDSPTGGERPRPSLERKQSTGSGCTVEEDDRKSQSTDPSASVVNLRAIAAPLQHAMNIASAVRTQSKRMSSYLSSSPKNYIDRWSDAIAGGKRQYIEVEGLVPDDSVRSPEQDTHAAEHQRRFREHFALLQSEKLVSTFYCWLHKTVPLYGKVYIGTRNFCFRSLLYGTKRKIVIPFKDIDTVHKQRGFRWGYPGMVLVIKGHEELFFDFPSTELRDDCAVTVLQSIEMKQAATSESVILTKEEQQDADGAANENELLQAARMTEQSAARHIQMPRTLDKAGLPAASVVFDDPSASVLDFTLKHPMRIVCLTIGSRGDVQPYIALCKGLLARGHTPVIATHTEFGPWVKQHGIEFAEVAGDPAELIRICVDNGMFTPSFFIEANSKFRSWLDGLLETAYVACKGADLLIESPSAMCGIHIAEALEIPYFRAFTMPWTRTRAYPHAFAVPNQKLGGGYNYMTYTFFDNMFWQAIAGQMNRWRGRSLGLGPTSLDKLQQNKVPFLYNFSPSVVVPPLDFSDWVRVTGYWFLDEGKDYTPPPELAAFIKKARDDGQKLVYIGFGSITVADSRQLTQQVVDAVLKADVRCILSKGWSDRLDSAAKPLASSDPARPPPLEDVALPPAIHPIRAAPHDWLFTQVDAVVHHGGAGTTGASLRAGVPTVIKPFFGDQYFFATRVADLGVGLHMRKLATAPLARALWLATHDARMRDKAAALGRRIRAEDGVGAAIAALERDLEYARSLIKPRGLVMRRAAQAGAGADAASAAAAAGDGEADGEGDGDGEMVLMEVEADDDEETEEKWTFIEKDAQAASAARRSDVAAPR